MEAHLSSEEMERALAGKAGSRARTHMAACAACTRELAGLQRMLGALKESATELAAQERRRVVVTPAKNRRHAGVWATAVAAVAMAAVAVPVALHRRAVKSPIAARGAAPVAPGAVSDAELMAKIQADLASNVPEPMQALEGGQNNSTGSGNNKSN